MQTSTHCSTASETKLEEGSAMKDPRLWMAFAGVIVTAWLVAPFVFPSRPPAVLAEDIPVIHYVCQETGDVFELPLTGERLDHPETGRPTLVPAVYDARRKKWRPGPPLEVMHRQGLFQQQATE
jgi:hypothetical protein